MDAILLHEFVPVVQVGALDSRCVELLQHGLRPLEDRYQLRLTPREWRDGSFPIRL
jgi:hypothetical protein